MHLKCLTKYITMLRQTGTVVSTEKVLTHLSEALERNENYMDISLHG